MTTPEPQPSPPPPSPPFQFSLRTLLLLFVVLGSSLGLFGAWEIVVFGLVVGLAAYLYALKPLWPLVALGLFILCAMCLWPALSSPHEPALRTMCQGNLHQIALALLKYDAVNGCFPPAYTTDKTGRPMLSWRVLILPYLDEDALYKRFDLTEPWDSPKNKSLLTRRSEVYCCPGDLAARTAGSVQTSYLAVIRSGAASAGARPKTIGPADFPAVGSRTAMLIEVADSDIAWTEPRDFSPEALESAGEKPPAIIPTGRHGIAYFFTSHEHRCDPNMALADGAVVHVPQDALRNGNFAIDDINAYSDDYEESCRINWPNIAALAVWLLSVGALLTCAVRSRKKRSIPPPPAC